MMKRRISNVSGISVMIKRTPSPEASDAVPFSQNSHNITAKTSLFFPANISGMEKARSACTATHIQPAAKAGNSSGRVMTNSVLVVLAPLT